MTKKFSIFILYIQFIYGCTTVQTLLYKLTVVIACSFLLFSRLRYMELNCLISGSKQQLQSNWSSS